MRWECEKINDPYCEDMPTSIVRIYAPGGFVVAADGREYDPKTGATIRDNFRKIFTVDQRGRRLTYALSGTNKLALCGGSTKADLDLLLFTRGSVEGLTASRRTSLLAYAKALSNDFQKLPEYEQDDEPTVIYLDGYYNTRPERAKITIIHNSKTQANAITEELEPGHFNACGSEKIFNALKFDSDERIAKYRSPSWKVDYRDRTLSDAIALAQSYIGAQCDDEVRAMDKKWFTAIGGYGHLCILKEAGQFEWMFRDLATQKWAAFQPTGSTVP